MSFDRKQFHILGALRYWYEGNMAGAVSTNNGSESLHGRIKRFGTLRRRMAIGAFVNEVNSLLSEWSGDSEKHTFIVTPLRTTVLEVRGYHHSIDPDQSAFILPQLRTGSYFVKGSLSDHMSHRKYVKYEMRPRRLKSFAHFVAWSRAYYRVYRVSDDFIMCTCPFAAKMFICKHTIAIERLKCGVDVSLKAKALPISYRPKRGRPGLVGSAFSLE